MKVGFNCRYLERPSWTGTEQYLFNLLQGLDKMKEGPELSLFALHPHVLREKLGVSLSRAGLWPACSIPMRNTEPGRMWWDICQAGREANRAGVDVYHGTSFTLPGGLKMPSVVTFFDLAFLRHPEYYSLKENLYLRWMVRHSFSQARAVITISEFSKKEIMTLLRADSPFVHSIPLGVRERAGVSRETLKSVTDRYRLRQPYLISISTVTARKNLKVLLRAMTLLKSRNGKTPLLCIAGRDGYGAEEIRRFCRGSGLDDVVVFTGPVDRDDLDALLAGATAALVPSRYEGFGLPVLEAMAAGVPVIAADASALPEVAGQAGLLAGPDDPAEWADKISAVLSDSGLRDRLINEGYNRAGNFSWQTTAAKTCEVYESVLS